MIAVNGLRFRYPHGGFSLSIDDLQVAAGERLAIIGPSGSGKTTLLLLIAGILRPQTGTLRVNGIEPSKLSDAASRANRLHKIGMVFQDFGLFDYLNATENILLPYRVGTGMTLDQTVRERAASLAAKMGIAEHLRRPVTALSQGEKQRVAVCRALITRPPLLLADEPTGNLDPATKTFVLDAMLEAAKEAGSTVVTVTHDHGLLGRFDQVVDFMDFVKPAEVRT
ncbi:ABC transporter ATP-binding protein [Zavarzinella formosa]|uniref:ABC transporter ATP-binding protein n=1 Tax=Zavarzinella formosa TaxID=360055 RepID=UPI0002E01D06|nr:ABC transporter ATP-binding protein [Zavarzinella formosa]